MTVFERGETYYKYEEIRNRAGTLVNPTTITMTITDSCGNILVNALPMANDAVGKYHYAYTIGATAYYGIYTTVVIATGAGGDVTKFTEDFVVMPWDLIDNIRRISGIAEEKSIDDDDLGYIALQAYREALDDVLEKHDEEVPTYDPSVGVKFNGTNTTVRTACAHIADHDGDGNTVGFGEQTCGTDVYGFWYDSTYAYQTCYITVGSPISGRITVTQDDGVTAIPSTNKGVFLTYWTYYKTFDINILRNAVEYLAANKLVERFHELHRATLADLPSNQREVELDIRRFEREYYRLLDKIRRPALGGGK